MSHGVDRSLVVLFAAAILLPGALWVGGDHEVGAVLREQRRAAESPEWSWDVQALATFPERWESYFGDAFSGRAELLRVHALFDWFVLGRCPTEAMVRGEEDWVFLARRRALEAHRGATPFDGSELESWRRLLEERRWWLAQRDIAYVYVLAPSKAQVYPERVPPQFTVLGPSRREQLGEHMTRYSDFPLTDYGEVLRAEKAHDRPGDFVYYPLGTHWTARGALAAYRQIVADLRARLGDSFGRLRAPSRGDVVAVRSDQRGDSWDGRMYLYGVVNQEVWDVRLKEPRARRQDSGTEKLRTTTGDGSLPRLLVLHDSFGLALTEFLPENGESTVWRQSDFFDPGFIQAEQPDAVVQIIVDRSLMRAIPPHCCLLDADELGALFEASDRVLLRASGAELEPRGAATLSTFPDGSAQIVTAAAEDDVLLPEFPLPVHSSLVVRLELSREVAVPVQVRYATRGSVRCTEERDAPAGRQRVDLHVTAPDILGRLSVRTGHGASRRVIHSVEVRATRL